MFLTQTGNLSFYKASRQNSVQQKYNFATIDNHINQNPQRNTRQEIEDLKTITDRNNDIISQILKEMNCLKQDLSNMDKSSSNLRSENMILNVR